MPEDLGVMHTWCHDAQANLWTKLESFWLKHLNFHLFIYRRRHGTCLVHLIFDLEGQTFTFIQLSVIVSSQVHSKRKKNYHLPSCIYCKKKKRKAVWMKLRSPVMYQFSTLTTKIIILSWALTENCSSYHWSNAISVLFVPKGSISKAGAYQVLSKSVSLPCKC